MRSIHCSERIVPAIRFSVVATNSVCEAAELVYQILVLIFKAKLVHGKPIGVYRCERPRLRPWKIVIVLSAKDDLFSQVKLISR